MMGCCVLDSVYFDGWMFRTAPLGGNGAIDEAIIGEVDGWHQKVEANLTESQL
jgi:hypothetical protein